MNSIKRFVTLLENKRTKEAWLEMTSILKESHQYFQNIPASERGLVLNVLFNERTGIVNFLNVAVEKPQINKHLEGTIIQMFQLLIFVMTEFSDVYSPHIKATQDICTLTLTIKASFFLKSAAAKAFVTLIKTFPSFELDLSAIVEEWVKKFKFYPLNERRLLLEVIAAISRHFPQTPAFARYAKPIRLQLMSDIAMTCDGTKAMSPTAMIAYVEATSDILHNFPPRHEDIGKLSGPDKLYTRLKDLCTANDCASNKNLMSAIVNLFAEHLTLFDDFVYADYEFWHGLFRSFVRRQLYGDAAIKALRMYYKTMGIVLGRKSSENDKKVFLNLREAFVKSLSDARLGSTDLRLTVYGFSQIIEPCRNYFSDAGVEEMFSLIAHRTIPRYAREDDETARFDEIADYQEALSRIIRYMSNVTIDQIHALTTLCSLLIKRFPELSIADQEYATASLNRTIVNVRYTKEILYQEFIFHIVYDGIVWSCSHMLLIDAELKRDVEKSAKRPITYKDYVPLWRGLLNPANYSSSSENSEARAAALRRVADETITTCVTLMNTLNLNVKSRENNVFSDVKVSQTVENESDFRIFLNLVDLYVEILANLEHFLWTNTLHKFIYEIVKNSYKNPLISGFYKLANVALTSSGAFGRNEECDAETFDLVLRYLWNTLDSVAQYPPELQISCLKLVLNVPEGFVKRIVERAVPAFKISFTIGLTNYEVATSALNALERWIECLGCDCPKDFVGQLVPCLEQFLQSEESAVQLLHDIEETKRRTVKKVTLLDDELSVEGFQKRILLFFGSLDTEVMHEFIHAKSLKTGATWSKKDLLKYSLPFPDVNLEINLDPMLPRVVELALSSGDRRTRVTAGEVLHTAVALMLGKTVPILLSERDRFAPLYEILCPALLRLGCDSDDVIMQLYNPLMMQMTHWLSSTFMLNSRSTIHLVDSLFDGLSDETNSSLRDVSGIYLAEFVAWSIKQSTDGDLARCPTNINLIVQRILNFAVDPSASKRVAAAIAFNHLYKILRENEEIVDVFWFEFLGAFVRSLDGCDDSRIRDAVRHVERVLLEKSHIFNESNSRRRLPAGFAGSMSMDAATWILRQCASLDRSCRKRCAELFASVARTVDGAGSARAVISGFLKSEGLQGLNAIVLGELDEKFRAISSESLEVFLRSLDLYVWMLHDDLVDHETLFADVNPRKNAVFEAIGNFVALMVNDRAIENQTIRPREFARLKSLRCEIVLTIFDFVPLALEVRKQEAKYVPDFVFNEAFFKLVSLCLVEPQKIGFDSGNLQLTEELPVKLEGLLHSAIENLPEAPMESMKTVFANDIQRFSGKMFQFDKIVSSQVSISEKSMKGLILLHKCGLLKNCAGCHDITANADVKIRQVFETLRAEELFKKVCVEPKLEVKTYFERLIELLLLEYDAQTMTTVVELLTNTDKLYRSDLTTTMTHGEYFQSVFKDVIIRGCLRDVEKTLNLLEIAIHKNPDNVLRITEALVLYLQRRRAEYREILDESADLVMRKFGVFERAVNNLEHRRNVFLNIYAVVVRFKRNPLDVLTKRGDIYQWILKELVDCNRFKRKIRLLRDFLVCLTDENSPDNQELRVILYSLKAERRITSPDDQPDKKFASPETVDCFQTLLKLLPITKSLVVFDAVVKFAQGAGKLLCEDKVTEYLTLYYSGIRAANVLKSLQLVYKIFMDSTDSDDRFDVLSYFLLPSFAHCDPRTMETFFENNIREIYAIIMQKPTEIIHDRRQLFVSKIGCYNLVEIMFANLPNERIDGDESPMTLSTRNETANPEEKFSKRIFRSTLPVRQLEAREGDDPEIFRRMQCAAYNCSIAIVSMTKNERFYVAVFGENREKRQLIWENIVDVRRKYELQQTSKEYPKERKKLVNIRKSEKEKRNYENYSYIKSYNLATSTLSDNICAYDLNAVNLMPQSVQANETMSLTLEIDDLNDHECMAPICALLIHMLNNEISRPADVRVATALPKWMSQFCGSMRSEHANVRLFMLKIVLNTQAVFKPYAEFFLEPIINTIYLALKNGPLNYVITDALVMLVDWRDVAVPKTERCRNFARLMFTFLLEKGTAAPTKYIVKYNMSIIEMIVDAWHECLHVPEGLNERMAKMDRLAVQLVLIFLTNRMAEKIRDRDDVWEFLHKCLADWKIEEAPVLQSFEAIGLMLRHSENREDLEELRKRVIDSARNAFRGMQKQNPGRLVKCVHAMCKACPELTEEFFQFVSSNQQRVEHSHLVRCLEVFSLMIPKLSPENIVKELNYMQFNALLENKVLSCEKICLQIVEQVVPILEPTHLLPMVELVSRYADHEVSDYRKICYDASKKLYERYSNAESGQPEVVEIVDISKRILLSGLLDPSEDVQKLATDFWSDATQIRSKCAERLLDILGAYTSGVEKNFLQIMTVMLLQLTKKSSSYNDEMFTLPLHNCVFHDLPIYPSRRYNFESRIPLFAPSLASQFTQRFTHSTYAMGSSSYGQQTPDDFMLRATNAPQFEATFLGERSLPGNLTDEGNFAVPKVPEIHRNKVSRRFLANWSDANSTTLQKQQAAKKFEEVEYRREYLARQRSSVKLYRKYKTGDFPDIMISHAAVLGPMQELVKRDPTICKSLIVSLIRSLIDRVRGADSSDLYARDLSARLTSILEKRRRNGAVIPAIFEILFNVRELEVPWETVTEVAKTDRLFAQGAILTERTLIRRDETRLTDDAADEPPAKRSRNDRKDRWVELAGLYESMNEVDVVLSIFRGEQFSGDLHDASAARAAAEWERAEVSYRKAFDAETGSPIRHHCLQGMFECMSRLSKWRKLEGEIDAKVKPNLVNLLDDDSPDDRWVAPWIFRTQTHRILDGEANDAFVEALQSYLQNAAKCQRLKELFGEETAVMVITASPDISRDFLNGSCEKIREEWIQLSPLAVPLRSAAIVKLQGIHDIDCYLRTIESPDIVESSRTLLSSWQNSRPSTSDDLLAWDKHLSYRSHFTSSLIDKLSAAESQEAVDIVEKLRSVRAEKMLKFVDCALSQRNAHVAKKYLRNIEQDVHGCDDQDLIDEFSLNAVKLKYLNAETSSDETKSLRDYASSWGKAHEILRGEGLSDSSKVAVRQIISTMSSRLGDLAANRADFFDRLIAQSRCSVDQDVSEERVFDNVADALNHYSFTNLKKCCDLASTIAECHLRLSKYCYEKIATTESHAANSQLTREFVRSTLRAMSCGSEEATHYFPCLLRDEFLADDETRAIFCAESAHVETWRFLIWQTQLLSHLGTAIGTLVLPIVKRMVRTYPNALVYSLRLTLDTKPHLRDDPAILSLTDLLDDRKEFNRFLEAIQYVVQPELCLEYHLKELSRNLRQGRATVVEALMRKVYPPAIAIGGRSMQGEIYRSIAHYKQEIAQMVEMPVEDVEKRVAEIIAKLRRSLRERRDKNRLKDYSPWLHEFVGREIEVPGQYGGDRKPMPRYHAKIVKIEPAVKVMQSKRKPIRVTIVANNARSYRFLVKFGEDLRLDQRVEQIFDVMNKTLRADFSCSQRRLSVDTYQVFPLSGSLGFLQWVDGTKTLHDFVNFSLNDPGKKLRQIMTDYEDWIRKSAPNKDSSTQYKKSLVKHTAAEVTARMTDYHEKIGWDLLRDTFAMLSPSMESFMSLRRNFTTSYATMCVAQWILGIGDRHLGNTLISVESGRSLGIDFGSAFGGAVDQSVPELVPFRLTAQIRGLLRPFNENDLMGATMTHVLRALRNGKGPLLACLNVVAHEQLNWEEHVNKLSDETQGETVDVKWLPAKKVAIVSKKLNGGKPSSITLEQLSERHSDKDYFYRYTDIVNGTDSDEKSRRSFLKEDDLSPEEQVQCLIEQATDLNVLGRTYAGWTPWL